MSKRTPSPWVVEHGYTIKITGRLKSGKKVLIAEVHRAQPLHSRHRSQFDNAALIAAAPDLYAALVNLVNEIEGNYIGSCNEPDSSCERALIELCANARVALIKSKK